MAWKRGGRENTRPRTFYRCLCCGLKRVSRRSDGAGPFLGCDRCGTKYSPEFRPPEGETLLIPQDWIPTQEQLSTRKATPVEVKERWANRQPTIGDLLRAEREVGSN